MTSPTEWVESDILYLVDEKIQESFELEYKACGALVDNNGKKRNSDKDKTEISKDVSAFANSAGGIIIYGVKETDHILTDIDNGFNPQIITKEWLEQVIYSSIHPRIDGLIINQIHLITRNPDHVIYVVYIPQATTRAPHQALDYKYYKRYNFQSEAMKDYEIRDILRRVTSPDLFFAITLNTYDPSVPGVVFKGKSLRITVVEGKILSDPIELNITIYNKSSQPANYAFATISLDPNIIILNTGGMTKTCVGHKNINGEYIEDTTLLESSWSIPNDLPIFKEQWLLFRNIIISIPTVLIVEQKFKNTWIIKSPGMTNSGVFELILTPESYISNMSCSYNLTLNFPE
ncbi:AlbA family DNA-binding domain-containing protein [Nostoc sp.]|uniref:AlbA family DNA-binding domain-containing protein n=1 Tax=Nostoc sp. TaxID=1180 RepID=UPI002FF859B0